MSSKKNLQDFEARTCVQAGWFGRAVKRGQWSKASAMVGGMTAGLASLAQAKEADAAAVQEEIRRASVMIDEIALHVSAKAETAAVEAYAAFLRYLPEAHARLGMLVGDDPGTRGGNKKETMVTVAERATTILGLG